MAHTQILSNTKLLVITSVIKDTGLSFENASKAVSELEAAGLVSFTSGHFALKAVKRGV